MTDEQKEPKPDYEPPRGAQTTATWRGGEYTAKAGWTVLRKRDKPSAELFSVSYVADDGGLERPGTFVLRGRPAARRVPVGRFAPSDAAAARRERGVVARVHRPRLRRSGRHRLQPDDR